MLDAELPEPRDPIEEIPLDLSGIPLRFMFMAAPPMEFALCRGEYGNCVEKKSLDDGSIAMEELSMEFANDTDMSPSLGWLGRSIALRSSSVSAMPSMTKG